MHIPEIVYVIVFFVAWFIGWFYIPRTAPVTPNFRGSLTVWDAFWIIVLIFGIKILGLS